MKELQYEIDRAIKERNRLFDERLKGNRRGELLTALGRFVVLAIGLGIVFFVLFISR